MLRHILLCSLAFLACSAIVAYAEPKDDVTAAVQKLADSPNYTFTIAVQNGGGGGFGAGTTEGKTEKDGYTSFSITTQDNTVPVIIKGDKAVIKTDDGWKLASDIMAAAANGGAGGGGGGFDPNMMVAMRAQQFKAPAEQIQGWLASFQNVQKTDDAYTADLSDTSAKTLLSFRMGRRPPAADAAAGADAPPPPQITVTNAKASIKFWIKDGVLSKTELHSTGTVSFNGNDRDVDRTTTTDIKDVGATTVDVPDEAKAKL